MKLDITVNIDWIEEDGSIDEEVKYSIIQGVKNAISKTCMKDMEDESKAAFDSAVSQASKKIEEKAIAFADEWLENEVVITDKWGDSKGKFAIKDMIKQNFDNLLERTVDKEGQFSNGYGAQMKLIEFLTNQKLKAEVEERMKGFKKDMDKRIQATIDKSIKDNVSDRFAQMVIGAAKQDYQDLKALESKEKEV